MDNDNANTAATATTTKTEKLGVQPELPPYIGLHLGEVTLIESPEQAAEATRALLASDAVGFDTESKPTFAKGEMSTGPHLIQLATDTRAYLFQTWRPFGMDGVRAVLESAAILKVGFGLDGDKHLLLTRLQIAMVNTLDLARALREPGEKNTIGARMAVARCFGQKLQKSRRISTSNWARAQLNDGQLLYAADDAHVALRIYRMTRVQLMLAKRSQSAASSGNTGSVTSSDEIGGASASGIAG